MNRPWLYADELYPKVNDGRKTVESLKRELKEKFAYIADLEEIALRKDIPIYEAFAGVKIESKLLILSPKKEQYKELLVASDKTPLQESRLDTKDSLISKIVQKAYNVIEDWNIETLKDDVKTSAENEMSIVLLGLMDDEKFLLTGDAGIEGLNSAMDSYRHYFRKSITGDIMFMQIPHHGGRHNVNPAVLNQLLGNKCGRETDREIVAFVSSAENSDHPYKMVVNAYLRRGAKVMKSGGNSILHRCEMPSRADYNTIESEKFNRYVEEWHD